MNVVITGASKGIGKAIVQRYAKAKHTIIACARNPNDLALLQNEIRKSYGITIITQVVDVTAPGQLKAFAEFVVAHNYTPDILVNNAGQFVPGSIYNEDEHNLQTMLDVNLHSAYHLTRALLPAMMERKSGHIFNMCSIASLHAYSNGGSYSISKFALLGFSKNLREEMKPFNIKVTAVCPGATMSDSWAGSNISPERIMEAHDIAEMIYAAGNLSPMAVVEDIVMRPQLGDL